jgi:hypothetical protein
MAAAVLTHKDAGGSGGRREEAARYGHGHQKPKRSTGPAQQKPVRQFGLVLGCVVGWW